MTKVTYHIIKKHARSKIVRLNIALEWYNGGWINLSKKTIVFKTFFEIKVLKMCGSGSLKELYKMKHTIELMYTWIQ